MALPKELVERIRRFRFAHQFDEEAHAYQALLERGLEAFEREQKPERKRRSLAASASRREPAACIPRYNQPLGHRAQRRLPRGELCLG